MESNFQKIIKFLRNSNISQEDQDDLIVLFSLCEDFKLDPVIKLFSEDQNWIKKISENYKAKKSAIADQDIELWQKIIQNEEKELNQLEVFFIDKLI